MQLNQNKVNLAYAILKLTESILTYSVDDSKKYAYVEMFANCREQGFLIHANNDIAGTKQITIAFSENRNSDSIVVYHSFKYESVNYSDEFWNNRKYFAYNEQYQASEYVANLIENL